MPPDAENRIENHSGAPGQLAAQGPRIIEPSAPPYESTPVCLIKERPFEFRFEHNGVSGPHRLVIRVPGPSLGQEETLFLNSFRANEELVEGRVHYICPVGCQRQLCIAGDLQRY
jgi:hypothetical protein